MSARVQALYEHKIRKVTRAYEDGAKVDRIARQVGVSPPTIARWLTREGYKHKRRGRYPKAMKARTRDLARRGWSNERIARLLEAPLDRVIEWEQLEENPTKIHELGGLRVTGGPAKKKTRKTQSKVRQHDPNWEYVRGRWRKKIKKRRKGAPPPRHKCRKKWAGEEKDYVLALMDRGLSVLAIYRRMRASRKRQLKIWRGAGRKGLPPGFPTAGEPRVISGKKPKGKITARAAAELEELEQEAADVEARRAALEDKLEADKRAIAEAQQKRKALEARIREEKDQAKALAAWATKKKPAPAARGRMRVEPESYEHEVLGLKVGSLVPRKAVEAAEKRKRIKKPKKGITDWADNKRYFAVSRDWPMLKRMGDDELRVVAQVMTDWGFPSRAEAAGDEPRAYQAGAWGTRRGAKWERARESALEVLGAYRAEKKKLAATKKYDLRTARYIVAGAKAARRRTEANEDARQEAWMDLGIVGQQIAQFTLRVADSKGRLTPQGMARSKAAERILESATAASEAKRVRVALEEKEQKKQVAEAEDDWAALMGEAEKKF